MAKVRRTPYVFLYLRDDYLGDVEAILRGEPAPSEHHAEILALAVLTGEQHRLGQEEFDALRSVPADRWVDCDGLGPGTLQRLTEKGLLLSDVDEPGPARLRERDEALRANEWNLYAALYHYMTKWSGVAIPKVRRRQPRSRPAGESPAGSFSPTTDRLPTCLRSWDQPTNCDCRGSTETASCTARCALVGRHERSTRTAR